MLSYRDDDEWFDLVKDCYASGMKVKDWCSKKHIPVSTFNHAVKRLKNKGYTLPKAKRKKAMATSTSYAMEITIKVQDKKDIAIIANILNALNAMNNSGISVDTTNGDNG